MARIALAKAISIQPDLLEEMKVAMPELQRPGRFSRYITSLIEKDLATKRRLLEKMAVKKAS